MCSERQEWNRLVVLAIFLNAIPELLSPSSSPVFRLRRDFQDTVVHGKEEQSCYKLPVELGQLLDYSCSAGISSVANFN